MGRFVKKGEKGIQILAPLMGYRRRKADDAETEQEPKSTPQSVLIGLDGLPEQATRAAEHPPGHPSTMPDPLRRLIEQEATGKAAMICSYGRLGRFYEQPGGSYDCSCFSQKVREYRMQEYAERAMKMAGISRGICSASRSDDSFDSQSEPQVNFKSCSKSR